MSDKTDKTPATAVEAEVTGDETIVVDWNGYSLTVPASADLWTIDTMDAFAAIADTAEDGQVGAFRHVTRFLLGVLGKHQWARVRSGSFNKASHASDLFKTVMAAYGESSSGE